jgi:hypothetical protein
MNYLSFHPLYVKNFQKRITFFHLFLKKIFEDYYILIINHLKIQ